RRMGEAVPAAKAASNPIRRLLMSAGYPYPSAAPIFYGIRYAVAILLAVTLGVASALSGVEFSSVLIGSLCCAGFGFQLPEFILKRMIRARAARIRRAIPVALDLLTLIVEAGQSLNQAIIDASYELREAHPDLSKELAQVHLELRAGKSRAEALHQ